MFTKITELPLLICRRLNPKPVTTMSPRFLSCSLIPPCIFRFQILDISLHSLRIVPQSIQLPAPQRLFDTTPIKVLSFFFLSTYTVHWSQCNFRVAITYQVFTSLFLYVHSPLCSSRIPLFIFLDGIFSKILSFTLSDKASYINRLQLSGSDRFLIFYL